MAKTHEDDATRVDAAMNLSLDPCFHTGDRGCYGSTVPLVGRRRKGPNIKPAWTELARISTHRPSGAGVAEISGPRGSVHVENVRLGQDPFNVWQLCCHPLEHPVPRNVGLPESLGKCKCWSGVYVRCSIRVRISPSPFAEPRRGFLVGCLGTSSLSSTGIYNCSNSLKSEEHNHIYFMTWSH